MPGIGEKAPAAGETIASAAVPVSVGGRLVRPECVQTHESGVLFASDWTGTGGVAIVRPDGPVERLLARGCDFDLKPNGIALEPGGSFLIAHLGVETGGMYRLCPDGTVEPRLTMLEGRLLPPSNFPLIDRQGRVWLTVSTRIQPRSNDYRASAATGLIILIDRKGSRIVADGLGYANECALSADERYLFVNETYARRLSRFEVGRDGSLRRRTAVATFGRGEFPDGVVLDREGGLWITSIISNRVIRIATDGSRTLVVEDADPDHVDWVEEAFLADRLGRAHLDVAKGRLLSNISSLAFGGPSLKTAYLGSLLGTAIFSFEAQVAGLEPVHYRVGLGPLSQPRQSSIA